MGTEEEEGEEEEIGEGEEEVIRAGRAGSVICKLMLEYIFLYG